MMTAALVVCLVMFLLGLGLVYVGRALERRALQLRDDEEAP